jgi:LEA14-like dessication related protein
MRYRFRKTLLVALGGAVLAGCAALEEELERRKPTAEVTSARLAALGFDAADLVVDVRIDNPNPVGVELAGFDYALELAGERLLSGDRRSRLDIPADGSGTLSVPLNVVFEDAYRAIGSLAGRDAVDYAVRLGLRVDLPGLGTRTLPVEAQGRFPIPRRPEIEVTDLRLTALDWGGARLALELRVRNPNAFGVDLGELRYGLRINGREWAAGTESTGASLPANGSGRISLPFRVDFGAIGRDAYRLLTEGGPVDYALEGAVAGRAGNELLGDFDLDFERSGALPVRR